jgi:hypothetical protein
MFFFQQAVGEGQAVAFAVLQQETGPGCGQIATLDQIFSNPFAPLVGGEVDQVAVIEIQPLAQTLPTQGQGAGTLLQGTAAQ